MKANRNTTIIFFIVSVLSSMVFGQNADAIISKIIQHEEKIRNVEMSFKCSERKNEENAKFKPIIYGTWRNSGKKEYIEVHWIDDPGYKKAYPDKIIPTATRFAYDGEKQYIMYNREDIEGTESATIQNLEPSLIKTYTSPSYLMGNFINEKTPQTFGEILKTTKNVSVISMNETFDNVSCIVLEAANVCSGKFYNFDTKVWLDPKCDYRPRKIEFYYKSRSGQKALAVSVDNIKLSQFDKAWLPVTGRRNVYSLKRSLPEGKQVSDYLPKDKQIDPEEAAMIMEKVAIYNSKLTMQRTIEVDMNSVKINHPVNIEDFRIEFPTGAAVHDKLKETCYTVGKESQSPDGF